MNQVFVFQECHGPESFRFEGLELPYLKKWTARHRLCQPLQCPEEQWGQKYVWLMWFIYSSGGKHLQAWISLNMASKAGDVVSSRTRGCSDLLPTDAVRGVLGRLNASFCRIQPPFPGAIVVGCSSVSPWSFRRISVFPLPLALFSPARRCGTCKIKLSNTSSLHRCFPSLSPGTEQSHCMCGCVRVGVGCCYK